jgi:putative NIF3 family GTP cyclohydrolase 1 type 2
MKKEKVALGRREFIGVVGLAAGTRFHSNSLAGTQSVSEKTEITVGEFMGAVMKAIPVTPFDGTVDTLKSGAPDGRVHGIATTFLATVEVLQQAIKQNANLILTHEPTFYNHLDETDWLKDDPVYEYKLDLISKNNLAIWRMHDYWHRLKPDPVNRGFAKDCGLSSGVDKEDNRICTIESVPLKKLALKLRTSLGAATAKVVGDPAMNCQTIGILPGAWGGMAQIPFLREKPVDALICGEINEWETSVYVQDAIASGRKVGLILLGHINTEEAGMRVLAEWLKPRFPKIPIQHIPGAEPFFYV